MLFAKLKKIEKVFILHCQLCLMPIFFRNGFIKVCLICHIPFKCACLKLVNQNIFCPAKFLCCFKVKFTPDIVFAPFHDNDIFCPTDFSHHWCEFFTRMICEIKFLHSPKICEIGRAHVCTPVPSLSRVPCSD